MGGGQGACLCWKTAKGVGFIKNIGMGPPTYGKSEKKTTQPAFNARSRGYKS